MERNLALTKGLYFSQSVLLALTRAGAERKTAYEAVQRAAMRTWKGESRLPKTRRRNRRSRTLVPPAEIDALCSLETHLRHVDATFRALGL